MSKNEYKNYMIIDFLILLGRFNIWVRKSSDIIKSMGKELSGMGYKNRYFEHSAIDFFTLIKLKY